MSTTKKRILVAGGGGFIGGHLAGVLLERGHEVVVADIKPISQWYQNHEGAENHVADMGLRDKAFELTEGCDEVYCLACNMGGMGFIENNRSLCMLSVLINTHMLEAAKHFGVKKYFYSSSACVYPDYRQKDSNVTALKESDAYPAMPENGYGWEKLFSERLCKNFEEDFGFVSKVYRFHNVYGTFGTWDGGREKAPAAMCRKVIECIDKNDLNIEIWGDGEQTRSFMYIDDCITGIDKLMASDYTDPLNLGRSELVTINQLLGIVEDIAGVKLKRSYNLNAPQGVRGRNSDNTLIKEVLGWEPSIDLRTGMEKTYHWIKQEFDRRKRGEHVIQ
jgi:GDP-D-mannose 3',5'-epimerase